ncbi:MAG: HAMP domain-containing sensor histidine kinase [bacterium]
MIKLVPEWALFYDEFWDAISRRNSLFIKLRYLAVLMLILFLFISNYLLNLQLSIKQIWAISLVSLIIVLYNISIQKIRPHVGCSVDKFNKMHLSLIQMVLDLILLTILVYYTGGINSPIYLFYIFHMIIGSLILPGYIIYGVCLLVIFSYSIMIFLQHYNFIGTHIIAGLHITEINHPPAFVILFILVFGTMMLSSVFLANKIARQLYLREQQLVDSIQKLKDVEIEKQKYIMGIVHEIKTPVAAVQSIVDIVLQKYVGPISTEVEEKLIRAKKRTEESINLINSILKISRLRLLNVHNDENLEISELLKNIIEKLNEQCKAKNIQIIFNDESNLLIPLKGDKVLTEIAFSNILSNSIKYTQNDGLIDILIYEFDNNLIITFNDNGIGIPKEEINKVFSQFYRASNTKNKNYEGSGMGLSVVIEILEKINGILEIDSPSDIGTAERPGTKVKITIPLPSKLELSPLRKIKMKADLKI